MITHSVKETRQQNEQWGIEVGGWRQSGSGEVGRGVGQNVKKRDSQYRGVFLKK